MLPLDVERNDRAESFYRTMDARINELQQAAKALSSVLSRAAKASRAGSLRALSRQASEALRVATDVCAHATQVQESTAAFGEAIDAHGLLSEVVDEAKRLGLSDVYQRGDAILSFPTRLTAHGGQLRQLGRPLDSTRPSVLASALRDYRVRAETPSAGIVNATFEAYQILIHARHLTHGDVVPIADIHATLTLLPSAGESYSENDLAVDLYSCFATSRNVTTSGYAMVVAGSTTTGARRGHRMVAKDGTEFVFSMVFFHRP
jgi:hypothetical protein